MAPGTTRPSFHGISSARTFVAEALARVRCEVFGRMRQTETALADRGVYLPDARLARLVLAINPFAMKPLAPTFAGPHDDQYGLVGETGSDWGLTATGRLRREVPDD